MNDIVKIKYKYFSQISDINFIYIQEEHPFDPKSMISSPKAGSSMCVDPNEVRYQKALKQITKLINLNNELREQASNANEQLSNIHEDFQETLSKKDSKINELLQRNEYLELQLNELTQKYLDLQEEVSRLNYQNNQLKGKSQISFKAGSTQNKNRPFSKEMIEENLQSSCYQLRKIEDLEKNLAEKNQQVKDLQSKLEETYGNMPNFTYTKNGHNNENNPLIIESVKKNIAKTQLQKKLKLAEEWNKKINTECAQLKAKLLQYESNNNALLRVKSDRILNAYNQAYTPRSYHPDHRSDRDDTELYKRVKKLEKDNMKLQKAYKHNQVNLENMKKQVKTLEESQKKLKMKAQGYERIIQKQQKSMEEMMKQYEKQLESYRDQFKDKLEEQRNSFSPTKNIKAEKMIQSLQSQNKAQKKKIQMCAVQLTKCFKTLEAYKAKLLECQKDYNQLAKDRQELLQKLTKIQGSHRDRSSHSRNSLVKQQPLVQNFGNSSIIQDV